MSNFHFKIVETKNRYWHWVLYANGKPIAASATATKSQKQVAAQVALVQKGAPEAALKIAPMKLDEHMTNVEAQELPDANDPLVDAIADAALEDVGVKTDGQSLPATEAVEG